MLTLEIRGNSIYFVCDDKKEILIGIEYLAGRHPKINDDGLQVTNIEPNFKEVK